MDLSTDGNSVVAMQSPPPSDDLEATPSPMTKEDVATTQAEKRGKAAAAASTSGFLLDVSFCGAASGEYYQMGSLEMEGSESTHRTCYSSKSNNTIKLQNTPIGLGGTPHGEFLLFETADM
jgi:hypothetical protein